MFRVCKTDLVLLRSRQKAHKIINHAIAEDTDVEWSDIKRKLMSNYRSTRSGIEASVKVSKLSMTSEEIVGEYLKRARTSRMLRRVSQFKTYKEFFNNIEDDSEQSYFMEDNFAGKEDTQSAAREVDKIYAWNETATDDPTEMLAEVKKVYWTPGPRPQGFRAPLRGG